MRREHSRVGASRAFTLTELIVVIVLLALLLLMTASGPLRRRPAHIATCESNLHRISQAVAMCYAENNDYGPTWDDGNLTSFMLTWTDLLYDAGYLNSLNSQRCPADERPDYVTKARGTAWHFYFVERFGVGEHVKRGVRTSYTLNSIMSYNFKQDRFADASRQAYAMDGWWTFMGDLNAAWVLYEDVTGDPAPDPVSYPHWQGTMDGWRHGSDHSANVLYRDGHVAQLTPIVPSDPNGLLTDTVDTMQSFTWLPGERNTRFDTDSYQGQIPEYQGLRPYFLNPDEGTYKTSGGSRVPIDYPDELSCPWRTQNDAWQKLPNDPADRR